MKKINFLLFAICCLALVFFSYGFVDYNFPLVFFRPLNQFFFKQRFWATIFYTAIVLSLFYFYFNCLKRAEKQKINSREVWHLIFLGATLLFFSWPAFSYDIFNYMATAKVMFFYKENPYLVMPVEFTSEPMLDFMHAANKTALYGPVWLLMTFIPHFFGFQNILLTVFSFKLFIALFYLFLSWLIWHFSNQSVRALIFFALNPLVLIETLVSGHHDVIMMSFVLISFWLFFRKKRFLSWLALFFSAGIKFATVILWPLCFFYKQWDGERLITTAAWLLFGVFLLSPLREEMYPWYFIWIIPLVALLPQNKQLNLLTLSFSFGLLWRYAPWFATRRWDGLTPAIKQVATFVPPAAVLIFNKLKEKF